MIKTLARLLLWEVRALLSPRSLSLLFKQEAHTMQAPLYIITTIPPNPDIQNTTFFQKNVIFYLITVSRPTKRYPKAKKRSGRHRSKNEDCCHIQKT